MILILFIYCYLAVMDSETCNLFVQYVFGHALVLITVYSCSDIITVPQHVSMFNTFKIMRIAKLLWCNRNKTHAAKDSRSLRIYSLCPKRKGFFSLFPNFLCVWFCVHFCLHVHFCLLMHALGCVCVHLFVCVCVCLFTVSLLHCESLLLPLFSDFLMGT